MMQRDYYQVLGVTQDASPHAIRAAFVRLSKRYHPDMPGSESGLESRLRDVQQAYHCLSDTAARAAHDQLLDESRRQHIAQQRAVQHRLRRYDRRHPRPLPSVYRPNRGRIVLVVAAIGAVLLLLSMQLG